MTIRRRQSGVWLLAIGLAAAVTLINQVWIGRQTLYAVEREEPRARLHEALLSNTRPEGAATWSSVGANSMSLRLLTLWAAEFVQRVSGSSLARAYFVIETAAVFVCCLLLFAFVNQYAGPAFGLAAVLYFASVLPLTYFLHFFHPWDKPSLATWLAAMLLTLNRRWIWLGVVLAIGVFTKFDIVIFPLFVFLALWRRDGWRRAGAVAMSLGAVAALALIVVMFWLAPGGSEPRDVVDVLGRNARHVWRHGLAYPPLLGLGVVASLAALGYRSTDTFGRAGAQCALVMTAILLTQISVVEFRAELPVLVLLMPSAIAGVKRLLALA